MAQNYTELQTHLDRVRWAWKRAAALQGLATVVIEALGMFLLFILIDYIYVLPQTGRVAMLALMGAILAFFFVRHVVRPLLRVISDEQIAMYIEERQLETEGALLTATSVAQQSPADKSPVHDFIVENIVQSAVAKAGQIQLSRVLNVAKLRKYGIAACIVLLFFGISALRYSTFFGKQATRLLMPWHMTDEDLKASGALVDDGPKIAFDVSLNPDGNRVLRGSVVKVKAKLSMLPANNDVYLHFRSKSAIAFQPLKMDEIDELNSFALRLPDVNDDLELYVSAGLTGTQRSAVLNVSVYDPLELKGYELTLVPPAYTKQPAVTEFGPAADISALEGTKVKLRAVANTALTGGEVVFDDGKTLKLTGETNGEKGAFTEFTVEKDTTYTVRVVSADEQKSDPSSSFTVKALKDEPPSVAVEMPGSDMSTHPGAEVEFRAKVSDDVGLASAELIYGTSGAGANDKTDRLALKLDGNGPGDHVATAVLTLSDIKPTPEPGSTLFYHIEARDLKGQPAISDIYMIMVRPYEVAGAFPAANKGAHPHVPSLDLMIFIGAAWNIEAQKPLIPKADYEKRCEELAGRMVNPDGSPQQFKKPKASLVAPEKRPLLAKGDELVKAGIATLKGHDAGHATEQFREALALWTQCGVAFDMQDKFQPLEMGEATETQVDPMQDALGFLKMDAPKQEITSPKYDVTLPGYKRALKPEEAKELRDKAQELQRREQQLLDEAKKLAQMQPDENQRQNAPEAKEQPGERKPGEEKPGEPKQAKGNGAPNQGNPNQANPQKPGEQQPGEQTAENKPQPENKEGGGEPRPTDPNAAATNSANNPDQIADRNERAQELQRKQEQLAGEARKLEQQAAANAANADKNTKEILDHFRNTTKNMDAAVAQMKDGNLQQAAAHGEEARRELHAAVDKLQVSQFDNLDQAVAAADERAGQIADTQHHIQEATQKVLDEAQTRNAKEKNNAAPNANDPKNGDAKTPADPSDVKLNPQDVQKLKGLAKMQAENQQNAENLEKYVGELEKWADEMHKKETAEELRKAGRLMKLEDMAGTMRTTAVNLAQQEVGDAKEAEGKLDKTLTKLTAAMQSANGSLAQTGEQRLKRAAAEAKDILAKAEQLAGKPADGDHKDGEQKNGEQKPNGAQNNAAKAQGENKPGDTKTADANNPKNNGDKNEPGKPDDKNKTGNADDKNKTANADDKNHQPGEKGENKPGEQTADQNAKNGNNNEKGAQTADAKAHGKGDKNEKGEKKELTEQERKELEAELYRDTQRLVKRLEQDKLADGALKPHLETIKSEKSFEEMFKEGQKTTLDKYLGSMHAVSSHLEDKLEMLLKAKRLSASQREQTPIQYREMVNKYYEQLAKE